MDYVIGAAILLVGVLTGAAITQPPKLFKNHRNTDEYISNREEE
jgi:hypothetical protein